MNKKPITKWLYWFTFAISLIAFYKVLDQFTNIINFLGSLIKLLMPFILATIIAYLFYMPVKKVEILYKKLKMNDKLATILSVFTVYIIAIALIILLINCVIPPIIDSVKELGSALPDYYNKAIEMFEDAKNNPALENVDVDSLIDEMKGFDVKSLIKVENIGQYIDKVMELASAVFNIFVMLIVSVYILLERKEIKQFFIRLIKAIFDKKETQESVLQYVRKTNEIFINFIYCQILDGILIGIITSIAMSIMGVKYAVLLGVIIGVFNIIPYFGAIIAIGGTILITILTGGINQAIAVAITLIALQQIDSNIINPKILGEGLKISPILVIFAVTVGGHYFGVLGMFLAVPIAAVMKILVNDYIEIKNKKEIVNQ
ncbi:MAG: AI-2E family transporter [Clostridia bacterium]|nr:AI-2E family transporter [Clostridia bacterium]